MNTHFLRAFVSFFLFHFVLNTKIYFQTAHRWSAGQGQARWLSGSKMYGEIGPHPQQLPGKEDPCPDSTTEASGKHGGSAAPGPALQPGTQAAADTQRVWAGMGAARNSTRGHSSFRNIGDSTRLAQTRLFGKQPNLWENTSWLRSLLSIYLCFPKV